MDRENFNLLLRDVLANIHDLAVLEKHPLNQFLPSEGQPATRAENLRNFIRKGITALRPAEPVVNLEALEWRYYLILHLRYEEGVDIAEIQHDLSLGERQIRRLHSRALSTLENVLWDKLSLSDADLWQPSEKEPIATEPFNTNFPVLIEPLALDRTVQEIAEMCLPRIHSRGGEMDIHISPDLPMVQVDRVILRQILLDLFNRVLQVWDHGDITIKMEENEEVVLLEVQAYGSSTTFKQNYAKEPEGPLQYWIERLNANLTWDLDKLPDTSGKEGALLRFRYRLELPRANQATIYVVDDHEPAIRIIKRYLSQLNVQVVGVTDQTQVMSMVKSALPQAVLLDVMMPAMDGWEILQKLKSDPETAQVVVIICSVWDQPELAYSLGANGFLKKPINQAELINELTRLNSLGTWGELHSTSS